MRAVFDMEAAEVTVRRATLALLLAAVPLFSLAGGVRAEGTPDPALKVLAVTGPTNLPPRQSEVQRLVVGATAGTFTLTFQSQATAALPFDATPAEVETALNSLTTIGGAGASVSVSGGPDGGSENRYLIAFAGSLAETNVAQLTVAGTGLGDGYANVLTTVPGGPGTGKIAIFPSNVGGADTKGPITVEVGPLPPGIVTAGPAAGQEGKTWSCTTGSSSIECTTTELVGALSPSNTIEAPVEVQSALSSSSQTTVTISGGGGAGEAYQLPIVVSPDPAAAGIGASFSAAFDASGRPATQAGGHPYSQITAFHLNTVRTSFGKVVPSEDLKDVNADLQAGLVGSPLITARCPQGSPVPTAVGPACSEAESTKYSVGWLYPGASQFGSLGVILRAPFYNNVPVAGAAAQFSTKVVSPVSTLLGAVRSEGDFGIRVEAPNTAVFKSVYYAASVFYGEPPGADGKAFFRNATDCAEQARQAPVQTLETSTWQQPGTFTKVTEELPPVTGCDKLTFEPEFGFQPTTTQGSSGAGVTAHLQIDQSGLTDPDELATPDLKRSVVTLPRGFDLNPAQANGLEACTEAQVGYKGTGPLPNPTRFDNAPVTCPDASKLGTLEATSPLLEDPLPGTIYLAAQEENPFDSLIAVYLVIESPRFGITLKLPGKVDTDPDTGQVTATFDYVPQQPIEDMTLHFRGGGPRSEFATPEVCGTYSTKGVWTPWSAPESGPPAQTSDSFTVLSNCSSSAASRPFGPSFEAGSQDPIAGAHSPLVIKVNRDDGEQELKTLDFSLPPGVTAKLAGVPYCPEEAIAAAGAKTGHEEQASPSCPAASQIGTVVAGAGVGSDPIHVGGKVYLAGPYKGAPLSAVVVSPAIAGPFDLGNVVVRTALYLNEETAQITAKSDPLPTILRGIPLKLRSIAVRVDRSGFALNPTSCEAMSVVARIGSSDGAAATPANRFQVGDCARLAFKPKLSLRLVGGVKRNGHPSLRAVLRPGAGANIAALSVALPHSEFLEQAHIRTICTRVQFAEGGGGGERCPAGSIYGRVSATSPLVDYALEGPVFLRSSSNALPDLVAVVRGPSFQPIIVAQTGRIDSVNGGIRTSFEAFPDVPISKVALTMQGGKKGLLVNSTNICKGSHPAKVKVRAQNGKRIKLSTPLRAKCGGKRRGAR